MQKTDLKEILATVEAVRQQLHPGLDADLLREIVEAEERNPENDAAATREIERLIQSFFEKRGKSDVAS